MVLNIFPRRREPAEAPAPVPTSTLPEPSPEAMAEIEQPQALDQSGEPADAKRRTRRGSRGGRGRRHADGQTDGASDAPEEPAATAQELAVEAAPSEPRPRAPRRTRAKATAELAPPTEEPAAIGAPSVEPEAAAPARSTRSRRAKLTPEPETAALVIVEPEAAPAIPAGRPARAPRLPRQTSETVAAESGTPSALLRAVEQQQKQIDQLVRLHEDLAKRVGSHAGGATMAPPARVGVFVDAANIELACDRLRARFDWRKILDMVTKDRLLVRAIAYSPVHDDPGVSIETQRFVEPFLDKGFKVVTKPLKRFADGTIKANVDIELALDIIEMLDRLDVVVLASGDGDFQRLVEVIQAKGIRVEVLSVGASTAANLRHAADKFIDLQTKLRELRAG
jgi:uncharacterized LabA/DUF88 family protein